MSFGQVTIMGRRCIIFACISLVICITNIHSLEEEKDSATPAEITIIDKEPLKRIEVRNFPEAPTVIHQGNNMYIKPKFIFGSPFTSYKQGGKSNRCCETISITSKVPDEETTTVIRTPTTTQVPTTVAPPVISPPIIEANISIPPPRFPVEPQTPIFVPDPCQGIPWFNIPTVNIPRPCPPFIVPSSPYPPQLPRFPIIQAPVRPVVIPKPPELPPMRLPKLPIQVLIKSPVVADPPVLRPIPDQPAMDPPLCPPTVNCIPPRQALPSITDMFGSMFEKIKNFLASRIDSSSDFIPDEKVLSPALVLPTTCARGIIAERFVPNIIKNDKVKVIMSPIFPSLPSIYQK